MKVIAHTELLEVVQSNAGQKTPLMHHNRDAIDGKGQLLIRFVQSWGQTALMGHAVGDVLAGVECEGHPAQPPSAPPKMHDLVMKAADMVDSVYDEMQRRGWMAVVPSMGDDE